MFEVSKWVLAAGLAAHCPAFSAVMDRHDLCARMELTAEVFAYDKNGKLLEKKEEVQKLSSNLPWDQQVERCQLSSAWSSGWGEDQPHLSIRFSLEAKKDGKLELAVFQYEGKGPKASEGKPIKEGRFQVGNMAPVMWESPLHENPRLVMRLLPDVSFRPQPRDLPDMEISGKDILIADDRGNVWASNVSFRAKYVVIQTHRGTVAIAFTPYAGATHIGEASGRTIKIADERFGVISFKAANAFVPEGLSAKVYGRFSNRKSARFGSVHTSTSNTEAEFLQYQKG